MSVLKLKIDVSGTIGDAAWKEIRQFDQIQSADRSPIRQRRRCNQYSTPPPKAAG
jgi:hypothetical protein